MLRLPRSAPLLLGASVQLVLIVVLFCWAPTPRDSQTSRLLGVYGVAVLWGLGTALNKTSLASEYTVGGERKMRQETIGLER
ncbi:hypothetical protein chiPu_0032813, partial [Chiloscyllium punctatum]|nr:hypothetical protein [Chiloscyllium punctatum]